MIERYTIEISSDLAVVGYNPESADMDHPRGEIVREVYFLQATNARGDRRSFGGFETVEAAEAAIPDAPMVIFWTEDRPEYGSLAYQDYGQDDDMESERRHKDAELAGFDTRFSIF